MLFTAEQWRERAEKARVQAGAIEEAGAKRLMLSIADTYERLAQMEEHTDALFLRHGETWR
jgi:hypothetical protein